MQERFKTFTVLITKINRSIHKIKTEEMEEFDLKSPHVACLYCLYKEGELTAKELCDACAEDKASVSRSVEYLEKKSLVVCDSDAKKRYKAPLKLTEKGVEIAEKTQRKIDEALAAASEGLSEENRVLMYECLSLISDNLQKICDGYEN